MTPYPSPAKPPESRWTHKLVSGWSAPERRLLLRDMGLDSGRRPLHRLRFPGHRLVAVGMAGPGTYALRPAGTGR